MTWGGSLGVQSRRDIETIVDAGLVTAMQVRRAGRWLRPTPLTVSYSGKVEELELSSAGLPTRTPAALTSAAVYLLAQHAPQSRAVALVTGSRLTETGEDVIEVWVEHRDGEALTVLAPLPGRGARGSTPGTITAHAGTRLIWASSAH